MVNPWLVGIVPALGVVTAIRAVTHRGGPSRRRSLSSSSSSYMHGDGIMDGYVSSSLELSLFFLENPQQEAAAATILFPKIYT